MSLKEYVIFTDGACSGNPGPGGWGFLAYDRDKLSYFTRGGFEPHTTNNAMELTAILEAAKLFLNNDSKITIASDSQYALQGILSWCAGWKARGWLKADGNPPENLSLWKQWDNIANERKILGLPKIQFIHVKGHAGHWGNEQVDQIAAAFAQGENPELTLVPVLIEQKGVTEKDVLAPLFEGPSATKSKYTKPVYLAFDGKMLHRFESWPHCQNFVAGRSGVQFKKVQSKEEESEWLAKIGLTQPY